MKKHFTILLGLLVIFLSLFTSCNEEELDPNICKITVKSEGNGKVSITDYIGTSVNVLIGNRVQVVATPDEGCTFIGWYISGTESPVSTDTAFTFTTSESVILTARFAKHSILTIHPTGYGTILFKDSDGTIILAQDNTLIQVMLGYKVTVVATPYEDYYFVGWFINNEDTPVSTDTEYTFTVVEDITLTAKFNEYPTVTVYSSGNGNVSIKDTCGASKTFLPGTEVTVIATPYKDCDFIGWFDGNNDLPLSTDEEYAFTVEENILLKAKFEETYIDDYEYVDLGLSVKWATYNVGATKPEECGGYYSWGETKEKEEYYWSTYKWCNSSYYTITKYCTDNSYGIVDNKTILDPEDDVAHVKWGGCWRTPTLDELKELLNNCTWTWITINSAGGYTITGPNGNSIFLPAAGYLNGTKVNAKGGIGGYWSVALCSNDRAYVIHFGYTYHDWGGADRFYGSNVRPVCE